MKKLFLLVLSLSVTLSLWAQQKKDDDKLTPYDLMSTYYQDDFNPYKKGNVYTGFAFSLTTRDLENTDRLIYNVNEGEQKQYDLIFKGGYFISNYNMLGAELTYARTQFEGQVLQDSENVLKQRVSSLGTVRPVLSTYFPLTKDNRLAFYNKMGLGLSFGNALVRNTFQDGNITKSYEQNFGFSMGLSPGITFFLMENFALEIELENLVGYSYERTETTQNGTEVSRQHSNNVTFDVNLLQMRLGIAYYINRSKK
ncbi:MAG: hypothetical protein ACK5JS_09850 [Mangrovibacterium sp.]